MSLSTFAKAALLMLLHTACSRGDPAPGAVPAAAEHPGTPDATGRLSIDVTDQGFVPANGTVKVGKPLTLAVTRKVQSTCATEIVINDFAVRKPLPLNETVEITFTPQKPGKIHFACPMDMIKGDLTAE